MHVTLIAAMAHDRVIGTGSGGIPWRLPRDAEHFRSFTAGKHLLLGRKTFEEMDGWFDRGQTPIVLTSRDDYEPATGFTAHSVDEALTEAAEDGAEEVVVCGGASVYEAALPYTDELYLTLIDAEVPGEVRFPDYDSETEWVLYHAQRHDSDSENEYPMTFMNLRRVKPSSLRPARLHFG